MAKQNWWGFAKSMIRDYPMLKQKREQMKSQRITPSYSSTAGGGTSGRAIEALALKTLPPNEEAKYLAVDLALAQTKRQRDGDLRCKLIALMYFKRSHTLEGAAMMCNVSYATAKNWHREFVWSVKANFNGPL